MKDTNMAKAVKTVKSTKTAKVIDLKSKKKAQKVADKLTKTTKVKKAAKVVTKKTSKKVAKPVAKKVAKKVGKKVSKKVKYTGAFKPIKETMNKSGMIAYIADQLMNNLEYEQRDANAAAKEAYAAFENMVLGTLAPGGAGKFVLQGIVQMFTKVKPARKAGTLVRNPATGQMMKAAAKPASMQVKARPLAKSRKVAAGEL